jgi:hypothetical protein
MAPSVLREPCSDRAGGARVRCVLTVCMLHVSRLVMESLICLVHNLRLQIRIHPRISTLSYNSRRQIGNVGSIFTGRCFAQRPPVTPLWKSFRNFEEARVGYDELAGDLRRSQGLKE